VGVGFSSFGLEKEQGRQPAGAGRTDSSRRLELDVLPKATELPRNSANTECQCGLTVKPCVAAECFVSKLGKFQDRKCLD